ncbi:MAG TPA: tRNA glutamyl-Q(34) synthetase GluQRS [Vicinamibacterales bacterium]|nr:tRNA glutamyl-Q(34) synthetase GluQRS [Vicinamibacterales bacterium]
MITTRFAPAPTGHLHIGHVVNALYVWRTARAEHGRVLLRIEDHDGQRCRREYETSILEDLEWLGFRADAGMVRQSDRTPTYETALQRLKQAGLVYACECSRREINEAGGGGAELRYPGTCAPKNLLDAPGRAIRVRLPRSEERFDDRLQGPQIQTPAAQCGDLLARDRHGYWTYQFAVTVDDFDQGVNLVIRGVDLLPSTGRQIQLARMLGRTVPPAFMHHPLVMKSSDQKVSKSDGDTGVREMRAAGMEPEAVIAIAERWIDQP